MARKKRFLVVLAVLILFITLGLISCKQQLAAVNIKPEGMAPDFTLKDLDGKPFRLSDTKGKVVIIDFWATWCPPCRAEIPHFNSLYKDYRGQGLEIIGISLDHGGVGTVKPFAEAYKMNYPVLIGNRKITADYGGIRGIPTTFIIDRQGRIVEKFVGYRGKEVFESVIKKLL